MPEAWPSTRQWGLRVLENEKKKQNQLLLIKISTKLGSGKEPVRLGQGGGESWQKWQKCFQCMSSVQIWKYQNIFGHMKTWYNSKIFLIFVNFSSMFFWVQNISIPPDQKFSIPSQQSFVGLKDVVLKTSSAQQFFVF